MSFFKLYGYELLELADNIAKEKGVLKDKIIIALENAINFAAMERYGFEYNIKTIVNKKTGDVSIGKYYQVVEKVENPVKEVSLRDAKNMINASTYVLRPVKKDTDIDDAKKVANDRIKANIELYKNEKYAADRELFASIDYNEYEEVPSDEIKVGDIFKFEALPLFDFGRTAVVSARKIIHQGIKAAEKEKQYKEFKDRVGEIVSGVVKRSEFNNVIVDLGRCEALLRKVNLIPRETFRIGDRVTAYIEEVKYDEFGYQVFLSRNNDQFLMKLLEQQVPEIYDRIIEVKSIARDPGSHAKIAVYCKDPNIDPIGTCVGIRGSRIQPIVQELQGEKIDIVIWSDNIATYIANAMSPSEVAKIVMDQDNEIFEVIVPDAQLSVAIGRRGQNVKLASKLTGVLLDIVSESDYKEKRSKEFKALSNIFIDALDCDEVIANLIVVEGYSKVEQIADADIEKLAEIEGFDQDIATEIQNRAKEYLKEKDKRLMQKINELKVDKNMLKIPGLSLEMIVSLADSNIMTVKDIADLSSFELLDVLFAYDLDIEKANNIVMGARNMLSMV